MKRGEGKDDFQKMFEDPQTRQMNELKNVSKKKKKPLSDELFLVFPSIVQNLTVFFNYLHDSNSIFRAARINSEKVSGATVSTRHRACQVVDVEFHVVQNQ